MGDRFPMHPRRLTPPRASSLFHVTKSGLALCRAGGACRRWPCQNGREAEHTSGVHWQIGRLDHLGQHSCAHATASLKLGNHSLLAARKPRLRWGGREESGQNAIEAVHALFLERSFAWKVRVSTEGMASHPNSLARHHPPREFQASATQEAPDAQARAPGPCGTCLHHTTLLRGF
jgi:hypothetical protein